MGKAKYLPNGKAGFSHKTMSAMRLDWRLFPPFFISNFSHNQSASRIVTFTFLTKSVSNESAFLVQRAHPYRVFPHNHTRTKLTASATTIGSTQLLHPSRLALITTEQSHHLYCFYCFYAIERVNYTCSRTYKTINLFSTENTTEYYSSTTEQSTFTRILSSTS